VNIRPVRRPSFVSPQLQSRLRTALRQVRPAPTPRQDTFSSQAARSTDGARLGTAVPQGPVFDGSRPAPGVQNTNGALKVSPSVEGDPGRRTRATYDNVINQFAVAVNPRYTPRGGNTYCNIFASDVMQAMGAPLPHWVDGAGNPTPDGVGRELDANNTNLWLNNSGPSHGWRKISAEEAQQLANEGHPVVASWLNPGGIGHIGVVRPGEMANGPALAQAGAVNTNSAHVHDIFPREGTEFWVHDGGTAVVDPNEQPIPIVAGSSAAPTRGGSAVSSPAPAGSSSGSAYSPAPARASSGGSAPASFPTGPSGPSAPSASPSAPSAPAPAPARPSLPAAGLDLTRYSSDLELLIQQLVAAGLMTPEEAQAIRHSGGKLSPELARKLKGAVSRYQTEVLKLPAASGAWDEATVKAVEKQQGASSAGRVGAPAVKTGASFGSAQLDSATDAINASAAKWGVPANFLKTIIAQESSGDWNKNNYTHSLRGDQMYPYIGMFRKTVESRLPGVSFDALAGNRDAQIDVAAGVIRKIYDQLQGMDKSYGWDNVASYYYSGKPTPDGWKDERGVSNGSYHAQTMKFWKFLEPDFDPKAAPPR
jgi:hypothetical protein